MIRPYQVDTGKAKGPLLQAVAVCDPFGGVLSVIGESVGDPDIFVEGLVQDYSLALIQVVGDYTVWVHKHGLGAPGSPAMSMPLVRHYPDALLRLCLGFVGEDSKGEISLK